jgi:prephenate dehydratase
MIRLLLSGVLAWTLSANVAIAFTPPGALTTTPSLAGTKSSTAAHMRVAYQGEPGAYSEKSTRELLGAGVVAIGRPNFESCFQAVASMECDYACLPIENSLGGSIHENYDLMLRYDLTICAEHEFRVSHCLLAMPGVKREDIKYAISHPQALAQCDNYLRGLDITPIPTYDTAGSAKMISENNNLPMDCTPQNTAAIASDLAAQRYGLNCLAKGVEDDDTNFTRFLLLGRKGVIEFITKDIPAKTSIVFTLPNAAGALYKALSCFSLRDIDCSKIESRPTSASLLNYLRFRSQQGSGKKSSSNDGVGNNNNDSLPRFRYCFYLDFLAGQLDENTENALSHLREQADYVRILGSYPSKSRLVGPVAEMAQELKLKAVIPTNDKTLLTLPSDLTEIQKQPLRIGMVGFGSFGQFLAHRFKKQEHRVSCLDVVDKVRLCCYMLVSVVLVGIFWQHPSVNGKKQLRELLKRRFRSKMPHLPSSTWFIAFPLYEVGRRSQNGCRLLLSFRMLRFLERFGCGDFGGAIGRVRRGRSIPASRSSARKVNC